MDSDAPIRALAISGSLRGASSNSSLIAAAVRLAGGTVEMSIYRGLAEIPPFNPDLDGDSAPEAVTRFRAALTNLRCGPDIESRVRPRIPGVLKNALDWVVGSGELVDKPIALINASGRATHAWASLAETLSVMSAQVIVEASITIPLDGRRLDANGIVYDAELSTALRSAIEALAGAARVTRGA